MSKDREQIKLPSESEILSDAETGAIAAAFKCGLEGTNEEVYGAPVPWEAPVTDVLMRRAWVDGRALADGWKRFCKLKAEGNSFVVLR